MEVIVSEFAKRACQRLVTLHRPEIFLSHQLSAKKQEYDTDDGQKDFFVRAVFQSNSVGFGSGKDVTSE